MDFHRSFIITIILLFIFKAVLGQKTDKVHLKNGDVLTGEIKGLSLAMLSFDMNGPGTISIKWEEVIRLRSDKVFEINMHDGRLVVGILDSTFFEVQHVSLNDIVELFPVKDKFIRRLSGSINLGFNFTKSSNILQSNLSSAMSYRAPKLELGLKFNSVLSKSSADTNLTKKQDLIFNGLKYFDKHYFVTAQLGWQQNTELGLSARFLFNGAAGRDLLVNNHNRLLAAAGFSLNTEKSIEKTSFTANLDGLAFIQYKRFYYSSPKFNLSTGLVIYPGITDWGRVRTEYDFTINVEIVKDFTIGLTFYDNYDSRPPEGASSKNDYGISFALGYQFGK